MVNNRFLLLLCGVFAPSACAQYSHESQPINFDPPSDERILSDFESSATLLGIPRMANADEFDQIHVIIHTSFDASIGLSLIHEKSASEKHKGDNILSVFVRDYTKDQQIEHGEVTEYVSVKKSYWTDVPSDDFARISKRFNESAFYNEKFADKSNGGCVDGTTYYIEAGFGAQYNLIGRSYCDKGYIRNFKPVDELISLAVDRFPMIAERLNMSKHSVLMDEVN